MEFDRHATRKDISMEDGVVYLGEDTATTVANILARRVPFKNEPFQPRPTLARVYSRPRSWFGGIKWLHPVAFKAHITMIDTMGCISSFGGMYSYLWVDADARLISRTPSGKFVLADVSTLTDEDIENLAVGVKGDGDLIDAEYEKVHQAMLAELEEVR